jgi:hypothetical protein
MNETRDVSVPDQDHLVRRRSNERRQLGDAHRSWLRDHSEVHPTSRVWALLGWRVDPVTVVPGLRIGSVASRRQARRLVADGVDCVVDLRPNTLDPVKWPDGILFTRLAMPGNRSPSADELLEAAAYVSALMLCGNELLLHCENGLERAPMVACAVLLLHGWSLTETRARLAACCPKADLRTDQLTALLDLDSARFVSPDAGGVELTGRHVDDSARQAART